MNLTLGETTDDREKQLDNLIAIAERDFEATRAADADPLVIAEASTKLWALRNVRHMRQALKAIERNSHPHVARQLAREGLVFQD